MKPPLSSTPGQRLTEFGKKKEISYKFVGTSKWSNIEKGIVKDFMEMWTGDEEKRNLGISFSEAQSATDDKVDIRIAKRTGQWCSQVGTDAKKSSSGPTMFLGDVSDTSLQYNILHELGHALGLEHEHQSSEAVSMFDPVQVKKYFGGPPNFWSEKQITENILSPTQSSDDWATEYDADSIMHYYFPPELLKADAAKQQRLKINRKLSDKDLALVKQLYPPDSDQLTSIRKTLGPRFQLTDQETAKLCLPLTSVSSKCTVPSSGGTTVKFGSVVMNVHAQNMTTLANATLNATSPGTFNSLMIVNSSPGDWTPPWGSTPPWASPFPVKTVNQTVEEKPTKVGQK